MSYLRRNRATYGGMCVLLTTAATAFAWLATLHSLNAKLTS